MSVCLSVCLCVYRDSGSTAGPIEYQHGEFSFTERQPVCFQRQRSSTECAVCLDTPQIPCTVPCGNSHVFCLACLEGLVTHNNSGGRSFPCPLCRKRVRIPLGGVAAFKNDKSFRSKVLSHIPAIRPRWRRRPSYSFSDISDFDLDSLPFPVPSELGFGNGDDDDDDHDDDDEHGGGPDLNDVFFLLETVDVESPAGHPGPDTSREGAGERAAVGRRGLAGPRGSGHPRDRGRGPGRCERSGSAPGRQGGRALASSWGSDGRRGGAAGSSDPGATDGPARLPAAGHRCGAGADLGLGRARTGYRMLLARRHQRRWRRSKRRNCLPKQQQQQQQ